MRSISFSFLSGGRGLCFAVLALAALPVFGAERTLTITAPSSATAGGAVTVSVAAATDGADGEQIGFFHAEYSTDGGKAWTGFCYEQNAGLALTRQATFATGAAGSKAVVRVRIAFRGGPAGDVDYNGAAIKWKDSWEAWEQPPAKYATINVGTP